MKTVLHYLRPRLGIMSVGLLMLLFKKNEKSFQKE